MIELGKPAMKQLFLYLVSAAMMVFAGSAASHAGTLVARVDVSSQTMTVTKSGFVVGRWKVSTARNGYHTPRGSYRPTRMHRMWYSKKYDNAPMPHSVFFRGGYAIHGTNHVRSLGRPASHGCIRL